MKHRNLRDMPVVSINSIRRLVIRSLVAGTVFGVIVSSAGWFTFYALECMK